MNTAMWIAQCSLSAVLACSPAWTAAPGEAGEPPGEPAVAAERLEGAVGLLGAEDSEPPTYRIRAKPDDRVEVHVGENALTIAVHSPKGIGHATITLLKGPWPENVLVRFHLRGLESFTISRGKTQLTGSVSSHSGNPSRLELTEDGQERKQEPGTRIRVLDSRGKPDNGLPGEGGYFEIALPQALFEGQTNRLTLQWIDFYRR